MGHFKGWSQMTWTYRMTFFMTVSFSKYISTQLLFPLLSVSQYLGQEKQKESSMWNLKLIIWKSSHVFFCFKQLQMLVDGAWEKDNIKTTECVCAHVHLVLLSFDWLWKSMDLRSYSVTDCSTLQFVWQDVLFLVLSQALNIHCNNVCFTLFKSSTQFTKKSLISTLGIFVCTIS